MDTENAISNDSFPNEKMKETNANMTPVLIVYIISICKIVCVLNRSLLVSGIPEALLNTF